MSCRSWISLSVRCSSAEISVAAIMKTSYERSQQMSITNLRHIAIKPHKIASGQPHPTLFTVRDIPSQVPPTSRKLRGDEPRMPTKKILLSESDIPDRWYNILPDLPEPPAPYLHP